MAKTKPDLKIVENIENKMNKNQALETSTIIIFISTSK